ncbi:hypothetical protein VTK26DRAFT_1141 [Humicola hyalothermophila]
MFVLVYGLLIRRWILFFSMYTPCGISASRRDTFASGLLRLNVSRVVRHFRACFLASPHSSRHVERHLHLVSVFQVAVGPLASWLCWKTRTWAAAVGGQVGPVRTLSHVFSGRGAQRGSIRGMEYTPQRPIAISTIRARGPLLARRVG